MGDNTCLFPNEESKPLYERVRPARWEDFVGIEELKSENNLISQIIERKIVPPSILLWGPPGSGKTTLARLVLKQFPLYEATVIFGAEFETSKVKLILNRSRRNGKRHIIFIDEIHRLTRAQQDLFLAPIEEGSIALIGATTENPSFYLRRALLSRMTIVRLKAISKKDLREIVVKTAERLGLRIAEDGVDQLVNVSEGDARVALRCLEGIVSEGVDIQNEVVSIDVVKRALGKVLKQSSYDKDGEDKYNITSAFIKSMRFSDVDSALYWGFRMLEGGEDPLYIVRRMIVFASEDIGNADPNALVLAVSTLQAVQAIGLPEAKIPIAQCIVYLSSAPKDNTSYQAMHRAIDAVRKCGSAEVPLHLRNAVTSLNKQMGYGEGYVSPHDENYCKAVRLDNLPKEVMELAPFYKVKNKAKRK